MRSCSLVLLLLSCGQPAPKAVDAAKSTATAAKLTAVADLNDTISITVTLLAADGSPVAKQPVSVAVSGTGTSFDINGTSDVMAGTSDQNGQVFVSLRSTVAEQKTVTFTVGSVTLDAKLSVTFVPGPVQNLVFRQQPTAVRAGQVMTPAVFVGAEDGRGNVVRTSDITISVRLVRSTAGVLTGGAAKTFGDGGVVFDMLTITPPQNGYALRAESNTGYAVESALFDVMP